jgi:hypothetical protein
MRILAIPFLFLSLSALPIAGVAGQSASAQVAAEDAKTYSGTLVDSNCSPKPDHTGCTVSSTTSSFAIMSGTRVLKFNATGNTMAQEELKKAGKNGTVSVTVTGKVSGNTIDVDSIQIH